MKKCLIVSTNFSPGHFSHMIAYYKLMESIGFNPYLYIDSKYLEIFKNEIRGFRIILLEERLPKGISLAIFQNPCKQNIPTMLKFKRKKIKNIYIFHEPWDSFEEKLKEGKRKALKFYLINLYQNFTLMISDLVLLPSNKSIKDYEKNHKIFNKEYHKFPLIFDDENNYGCKEKKYFSFIGGATKSRAFERFLEFIKFSSQKDNTLLFQICTRTDIRKYLDPEIKKMISEDRLIIQHGRVLTNDEINQAYSKSFGVWNVYNRSTQSGVLAKAMMFGCASLASDIGSFSENINQTNGIISKKGDNMETLLEYLYSLKNNKKSLSEGSRRFFMDNNYYLNQRKELQSILNTLKRS